MTLSRYKTALIPVLAFAAGAVLFTALRAPPAPAPMQVDLGISAYVLACAPKDNHKPECASVDAIKAAFKFDLMTEVESIYKKMQKTAGDIAAGRLTDEAYESCLSAGTCASVPMLGKTDDPKSPQGKKISKAFWHLADGHPLSPELCGLIQICDIGLRNGALIVSKIKSLPPE